MRIYRVVEELGAPESERYQVQGSNYGHTWHTYEDGKFPDQVSAEIHMERLANPRVVATLGEPSDFAATSAPSSGSAH